RSIQVIQPAPSVSVSLSPATVNEGGVSTLTWSSLRARNCTVPGVSGNAPVSGNIAYTASDIVITNKTTQVIVTCSGGGGSGSGLGELNIIAINDHPTISSIAPIAINEDTSSGAIGFV